MTTFFNLLADARWKQSYHNLPELDKRRLIDAGIVKPNTKANRDAFFKRVADKVFEKHNIETATKSPLQRLVGLVGPNYMSDMVDPEIFIQEAYKTNPKLRDNPKMKKVEKLVRDHIDSVRGKFNPGFGPLKYLGNQNLIKYHEGLEKISDDVKKSQIKKITGKEYGLGAGKSSIFKFSSKKDAEARNLYNKRTYGHHRGKVLADEIRAQINHGLIDPRLSFVRSATGEYNHAQKILDEIAPNGRYTNKTWKELGKRLDDETAKYALRFRNPHTIGTGYENFEKVKEIGNKIKKSLYKGKEYFYKGKRILGNLSKLPKIPF